MKILNTIYFLFLFITFAAADSTTWVQKANMEATSRHRCNDFTIGNKGYFGLGHHNSVAGVNTVFADFWEYDPATDSWTQKADFGQGETYHCFDFVIGKKAFVGCGRNSAGTQFNDMWEFDPVINSWTKKANFPGSARSGPKAFVIDSIAYAGSGLTNGSSTDNAFYAYNPITDSWTQIASFPGPQRNDGVAFSIHKIGYYGTGQGDLGSSKDFWAYNPLTNAWTQKTDVGPISRGAAIAFVINDLGYIMSGITTGMDLNDVWEYNPTADTWSQIGDFPGTRRHFMASFVINNKAYCGSGTSGINFNDLWVFDARFKSKSSNKINYDPYVLTEEASKGIHILLDEKLENYEAPLTLIILDAQNNNEYTVPFTGDSTYFNGENLPSGIYFYQIHSKEKMIQYGRFEFK